MCAPSCWRLHCNRQFESLLSCKLLKHIALLCHVLLFHVLLLHVLLFHVGEDRATVPLKGKVTEDSIADHLKAEKLPPTIAFNDKNSQKIFSSGIEKQVSINLASGRLLLVLGWYKWHVCE